MEEKSVRVPNISCGHCVMTIQREIGELDGVKGVEADLESKQVTIRWDTPVHWDAIAATLKEIGYPAEE